MSLVRLTGDNIVNYTTVANPKTFFASSSSGVTGSLALNADFSPSIKNAEVTVKINQGVLVDRGLGPPPNIPGEHTLNQEIGSIVESINSGQKSINFNNFFKLVKKSKHAVRHTKKQEVRRFIPGTRLSESLDGKSNYFAKFAVQNVLMTPNRVRIPSADWAFTNYNCLNFFTGKGVPKSSVLIYPSPTSSAAENPYAPEKAFTFDFYIKPKGSETKGVYNPGTILHMSSCYAISLHSGSDRGPDGSPSKYRLVLQLSRSADIPPSKLSFSGDTVSAPAHYNSEFVYATSNNKLTFNKWHHIAIRWAGKQNYNANAEILIDGKVDSTFKIPSSSVMQATGSSSESQNNPDALFVGNYYEGTNKVNGRIAKFFAPDIATNEGVSVVDSTVGNGDPAGYAFRHCLNAEVHDIKIYNHRRTNSQVNHSIVSGSDIETGLLFHLPPFFVRESRRRKILQSPFQTAVGVTDTPFNKILSFGVGGLEINLENYTRDFVRGEYPRLLNLTGSEVITNVTGDLTCNDILYSSGSFRKRNLTILPCDNGIFYPNFSLLHSSSAALDEGLPLNDAEHPMYRFVNDDFLLDKRLVSLRRMVVDTNRASVITTQVAEELGLTFPLPENLREQPSYVPSRFSYGLDEQKLAVFNRTGDNTSSEVVFFDISNLMYGDKIKEGTVVLKDVKPTGSIDLPQIILKDDKNGNLYRADAKSRHATWASVGNVFYEYGILVIKTPHLPFFGKDSYSIEFQGRKKIYTLEVQVPLTAGKLDNSFNPTFKKLIPSDLYSETADQFVYVSGVNLHDNNLNVLMRTNLVQPIVKREGDRVLVKIRMDF